MCDGLRHQVGADDGGLLFQQAAIDDLIQRALDEGGHHLRPQVVQDQQIAVQHPLHVPLCLIPAKFLRLEPLKNVPRRVIYHGEALAADLSGDGGGQVGLSQPRTAEQQQVGRFFSKIVRIFHAGVVHPLHVLPGRLGFSRCPLVGIPVGVKGVKALAAQIQQLGKLLALFLHIVGFQAAAHLAAPVARVIAEGAKGRILQCVVRQAQLRQQHLPFCLQAEVFFPQALDFRQRVLSPPQSGGHHPAGRAAQLILNFPQPGSAGIELFPLLRQIRFPGAPIRFIPLLRQTQQPSVVCHVSAPSLHVFPGIARRLRRLLRRGLVRPFDLLRSM